ncbi:MAG: TatD family hydrolase [Candidatus Saccharibacteria bacterium]|nr:TatD family hydrolase [Candidatus Saccharibacteria bacterium]
MLIDSHSHIHGSANPAGDQNDFDHFGSSTTKDLINRAVDNNVTKIVTIGTSYEDSMRARDFTLKFNSDKCQIFWTYGVHPNELEKPREIPDFSEHKPIAIGEVGLDYHYGPEFYVTDTGPFAGKNLTFDEIRTEQIKLLEEMLDLATKNNLPVSFHIREAFDDFFGVINNFGAVRGVIHSFTDNKKNLKRVLDAGFYVGVNGIATYSTLPLPPLDRILTETDAPYLAPVPHRREINEPSYIKNIAEWIAEQHQVSLDEVERQIEENFKTLFL